MGTGVRFACITHGGPSLARIGAGPERRDRPESGLWWREEQSNPQNAVTDSVENCLLQGLRYYETRRAVIIRSVGRPKIVCVGTEPA